MTRRELAAALRVEAESQRLATASIAARVNAIQDELTDLNRAHAAAGSRYSDLISAAQTLEALDG